mgnify:CR=1 FL=1
MQLVPILSFIDGVWSVEFKIGSASNGSSYVLKSIPQFVLAMANGDYADYGQKLAFIHTPDMLDDDSRPLLDVLDDAMAVRRAAEQQDRYYGHIAIDRHLTLSAPEVARLLSVREGRGVQLVLNTWFSGQLHRCQLMVASQIFSCALRGVISIRMVRMPDTCLPECQRWKP